MPARHGPARLWRPAPHGSRRGPSAGTYIRRNARATSMSSAASRVAIIRQLALEPQVPLLELLALRLPWLGRRRGDGPHGLLGEPRELGQVGEAGDLLLLAEHGQRTAFPAAVRWREPDQVVQDLLPGQPTVRGRRGDLLQHDREYRR